MALYRKKPVEIEAVKFVGLSDFAEVDECGPGAVNFDDLDGRDADDGVLPEWLTTALLKPANEVGAIYAHIPRTKMLDPQLRINTLEGHMIARPGDLIIRGVEGEIYPCKPAIFAKTYEPVGTVRFDVMHGLPGEPQSETVHYPGPPLCGV